MAQRPCKLLLAALLALVLTASACQSGSHRSVDGSHSSPTTAKARPFSALAASTGDVSDHGTTTADETIAALARVGIATVTSQRGGPPLVAVTEPEVSQITRASAASLAAEASSGGGLLGSGIDQAFPLHGDGSVPITMTTLIGAWVVGEDDSASRTAGQLMGTVDWTHPASVVIPGEVVALFTADLAQHVQSTGAPSSGAASPAAYLRTGVPLDVFRTPCTSATKFINDTMNTLFGYLHIDAGQVQAYISGHVGGFVGTLLGWLGGFAANLVNGLVDILHVAADKIVGFFTGEVMSYIQTGIALLYTAENILKFLSQDDGGVHLTADPAANSVSTGTTQNHGAVTVSVPDNDPTKNWPEQIKDCANWAKVPPPRVTAPGAEVDWTAPASSSGLVAVSSPSGPPYKSALDDALTDTLTYVTAFQTKKGSAQVLPFVASVAVDRDEVRQVQALIEGLFVKVPTPLKPFVSLAVGLAMSEVRALLHDLVQITAAKTVPITYYDGSQPTLDASCPTTSAIPAGSFSGSISSVVKSHMEADLKGAPFLVVNHQTHFTGTVALHSDGSSVTGSLNLTGVTLGQGSALVGAQLHDQSTGVFHGKITGPAANPMVQVRASGRGHDNDPLGIGHDYSGTYNATVGLHVTGASCNEVDGDLTALVKEMFDQLITHALQQAGADSAEVDLKFTMGGDGDWTALAG